MAVGKFHLPIANGGNNSGGGNLTPTPYVRPVDWLAIDHLVTVGEQKFVGLIAVMEEGNWVTVLCRGAFTVDWGDGTIIDYTTNTIAQYQHSYSSFVGTECSRGYRQAIVTVTPQVGQDLTQLYLHQRHTSVTVKYDNRWLDIKMSAPNITNMLISSTNNCSARMLEQFDYIGTNIISSMNYFFYNCISLQKVKNLFTQNVTTLLYMFFGCYSIEEVDFLVTPNVENFSGAFSGCLNIKRFPSLDTSKGVSFLSTFNQCGSIVEFPTLNCNLGTNFSYMFSNCYSMLKNPIITTSTSLTKNFANMFSNCYAMVYFVDFNTQRSNNYSSMFKNCYNLRVFPTTFKTNTDVSFVSDLMFESCNSLNIAPEMDLTTCTTTSSMFANCFNLEVVPDYIFGGTSINAMFANSPLIKKLPNITFLGASGTVNMGSVASGCIRLEEAPNWDMSKAFDVNNFFNGNPKILRCPAWNLSNVNTTSSVGGGLFMNNNSMYKNDCYGMRYTISFQSCNLSQTELVKIFNNLGTASGTQTITISGNYGASTLTTPERAIATGKGWTIVG